MKHRPFISSILEVQSFDVVDELGEIYMREDYDKYGLKTIQKFLVPLTWDKVKHLIYCFSWLHISLVSICFILLDLNFIYAS